MVWLFVRLLFVFDFLFDLFMIAWWPSTWKELISWASNSCCLTSCVFPVWCVGHVVGFDCISSSSFPFQLLGLSSNICIVYKVDSTCLLQTCITNFQGHFPIMKISIYSRNTRFLPSSIYSLLKPRPIVINHKFLSELQWEVVVFVSHAIFCFAENNAVLRAIQIMFVLEHYHGTDNISFTSAVDRADTVQSCWRLWTKR